MSVTVFQIYILGWTQEVFQNLIELMPVYVFEFKILSAALQTDKHTQATLSKQGQTTPLINKVSYTKAQD